jgi:transposase
MSKSYFIGLDIAKNVFQIFSADESGKAIANKKMSRNATLEYFTRLVPSTIGIEACGTAHYWARTLT